MNLCYTIIFGSYDNLKTPAVITPGWKYICITDQPLKSDVWEIKRVTVDTGRERYAARFYKIAASLGAAKSIYADASFLVNTDLNEWWSNHFKSPMTCIKHPIRDCVYEEADAVIRNGRGGYEKVHSYMRRVNIPAHNGLIQSGVLMREHTVSVRKFCEEWWKETVMCLRDQITFAVAVAVSTLPIHYIDYDYRKGKEFEYNGHIKKKEVV